MTDQMLKRFEWLGWLVVLVSVLGYGHNVQFGASAGILAGILLMTLGTVTKQFGMITANSILTVVHIYNLTKDLV